LVRELNSRSDICAQSLARGRSCLLDIVISDIVNPFFPEAAVVLCRNLAMPAEVIESPGTSIPENSHK
jgi:DNA-binding LacI/PurR family transcriptional regulator